MKTAETEEGTYVLARDQSASPMALISTPRSDRPAAFTLAEWPREHDDVAKELAKLQDKFSVNPLSAYNDKGELIEPNEYESVLREALVVVHFTLTHWSIKNTNGEFTDSFAANIENIKVLRAGPGEAALATSSPRSVLGKRFRMVDPLSPPVSPSAKKSRPAAARK